MSKVSIVKLGHTGLKVSQLGFGTFDFGIQSRNVSPEEGGRILIESYKLGVNFWDTSDDYGSHPHIAWAIQRIPRQKVVISTKTSAKSGTEAKKSLNRSLAEIGTDYVDIFLLHFVQHDWIDGCCRVLKELNDLKTTGLAKAIGLSTHSVAVVREASRWEELDVIMTICCKADQSLIRTYQEYIPLEDGSIDEMLDVTELAHSCGKGICAIKVLGNGALPLVKDYRSAIESVAQLDFVDTVVIGMRSLDEVIKNVKVVTSCLPPAARPASQGAS